MEFYLPNIAFYAMALLVSSSLLYIVGRAIVCLLPEWRDEKNGYQTTFNSYMLGYTVILPIFAIIWSRENTIFLVAAILWLIYLLWWRKPRLAEWKIDWRLELKAFFVSMSLLLGCFAFLYYLCFVRSEGQMFTDQIYFSNLSQSILDYHNEAHFRTDISFAQMYHWGDSWTTALWTLLFDAKPIYILYCITYPFLLAMCMLGITSIVRTMSNKLPIIFCIALGVLYFFIWRPLSLLTPWHDVAYISWLKNYLIIVFGIWSASYLLKREYAQCFFAVLMLVVYYSTCAAGVLTLVCLLSFFIEENPKCSIRVVFNPYVIGSVIIALCYGAFYIFQPEAMTDGAHMRQINHSNLWVLGFILKRSTRPFAAVLPTALIVGGYLYMYKKHIFMRFFIIFACVLVSCFAAYITAGVVSKGEVDAWQIGANYDNLVVGIFVYLSFIYLLLEFEAQYKKLLYALIIILCLLFPGYFIYTGAQSAMFPIEPMCTEEKDAYLSLKSIFDENPAKDLGYFRNYTLPENHNSAKTEYDLYFPMDRVVHFLPNGYHPYCLSVYDLPSDIDPVWNNMAESELWQYGVKQIEENPECTLEQIINSFIEQRGINYVFVEKGANLPEFMADKFDQVFEWDDNILYYAK